METEVSPEEVRTFLARNRYDLHQQFICAEAVAGHFGLPIYAAQALIRSL